MDKDDGGPAFPRPGAEVASGQQEGMSLRDYFAGQVLSTLADDHQLPWQFIADRAYTLADAMLEARKK